MPVILTFFNTRTYTLDVRRTSNQTDSGVTFSRSTENHKKGLNGKSLNGKSQERIER